MLTEEQLAVRQSGIGASEAAAVLGLSPWDRPIDVYLRKVGLCEARPETPAMRLGSRLEGVVLDLYEEETGTTVFRTGDTTLRHPTWTVVLATPDGEVSPSHLVEAKTTSHDDGWGEPGTDQIPEHYLVQVAVQMAVTGAERCDVAVLNVLRREFRIYRCARDRALEAAVVERLVRFWSEHVKREVPPPIDGSAGWTEYLKARFPRHGEALLPADDVALVETVRRIADCKADLRVIESVLAENENVLRARIGDHAGVEGWWGRATWKRAKDSASTDWRAVAEEAMAFKEADERAALVARHTTTVEGARRLLVSPAPRLLEQGGQPPPVEGATP